MEGILANKDYQLYVDEKLKPLFPPNKLKKVKYFFNPRALNNNDGRPHIIISAENTPQLASLAEEPDNFVVVVGAGSGLRSNGNTLVVGEEEVPGLLKRL